VLMPDFVDKLTRHKKVRLYGEIASEFASFDPGAWSRAHGTQKRRRVVGKALEHLDHDASSTNEIFGVVIVSAPSVVA